MLTLIYTIREPDDITECTGSYGREHTERTTHWHKTPHLKLNLLLVTFSRVTLGLRHFLWFQGVIAASRPDVALELMVVPLSFGGGVHTCD